MKMCLTVRGTLHVEHTGDSSPFRRCEWVMWVWPIRSLEIIHIYQPLRSGRIRHKVSFKAEFNRLEFRVLLLLNSLPHQGWRTQSVLLFTHSWRENIWIHTFPKGISTMWNAISPVQVWIRVTVSISYDKNHYTTRTSFTNPSARAG